MIVQDTRVEINLFRLSWLQEPAASTNVEPVFVVDRVEGKDGFVRAAKADAGVAAPASGLVASGGRARCSCWSWPGPGCCCGDWRRSKLGRGRARA